MNHHSNNFDSARIARALVAALLLAAPGCVSQDQIDAQNAVNDYYDGNFAEAKRLLTPLAQKTNEDFVLNNVRLGSTTLAMFDLTTSQSAFLQAYEVLNSYGVNNGGRTLGAVLVDEKLKVWRGEPFERAMANFYLGLTYYMQRDYNNARAAFENSLFKLHEYAEDADKIDAGKVSDVDSNFILANYMLGRCHQHLGQDDDAAKSFFRVRQLRASLNRLADVERNRNANVLLVIDYGHGPRKVTNEDGTFFGFYPTPLDAGPIPEPVVQVDDGYVNDISEPLVDLVTLAQDRKWQSIDTIRTIKSVLGTGAIAGGAYETLTARNRTDAAVGLGLLAAGVLLKATSQADIRVWELLPRSTFIVPLSLPPGRHDITVTFMGNAMRQTLHGIIVPADGESTYYFRLFRQESSDQTWPPNTLTGWPESPLPIRPVPASVPAARPGVDQLPPP